MLVVLVNSHLLINTLARVVEIIGSWRVPNHGPTIMTTNSCSAGAYALMAANTPTY